MRIVWSRRALRHLRHLRDYIAQDNPDAAPRVAERLLASVELLAVHPDLGRPGRVFGTRELVVPDTPCVIPYRVRGARMELIAVFHGRQKWPGRL
jgi:toxin ParE1/3/4